MPHDQPAWDGQGLQKTQWLECHTVPTPHLPPMSLKCPLPVRKFTPLRRPQELTLTKSTFFEISVAAETGSGADPTCLRIKDVATYPHGALNCTMRGQKILPREFQNGIEIGASAAGLFPHPARGREGPKGTQSGTQYDGRNA